MAEFNMENSALGVAAIVGVAVLAYFFQPELVSRGATKDVTMGLVGHSYTSNVRCGKQKKKRPSMLKGFFGGEGKKVRVMAVSFKDAVRVLEEAYPGCDVGFPSRSRRTMLRRNLF